MDNTSTPSNKGKARTTIALFGAHLVDHYQTSLLDAAVKTAREQTVNLVAYSGGEIESAIEDRIQLNVLYDLANKDNMDALLLLTVTLRICTDTEKMASFVKQYEVPTISLESKLPNIPTVMVTYEPGMRALIRHLITVHGFRRIAFIDGPTFFTDEEPAGRIRFQAYLDVLAEYDIPYDPQLTFIGDWVFESGKEAIRVWLDERKVEFDAVVAASDAMAIGALQELQQRHIIVPDQIAVAGFDDIDDAALTVPPLTTVRQPEDFAQKGMDLALAAVRGETVPESLLLDMPLVIRESCGCTTEPADVANVTYPKEANRPLQFRYRMRTLSSMIRTLIAAPDMTALGHTIMRALPDLGIKTCFIALYDGSLDWCRIILGYDEECDHVDLDKDQRRMRSSKVINYILSAVDRPCSLLVQGLQLNGAQLGFLVLDVSDPHLQTPLYEIFREQLGSVFYAKHAMQQLEENRNLLRTVIDNLPDHIFAKDRAGHFLISNFSKDRSTNTPEFEKNINDSFAQQLAAQSDSDDLAMMQSGQSLLNRQHHVVDDKGDARWFLTTKVPLRDSQENVVGLVGISRDISELKRTEEALALARDQAMQASRLKSQFLANMSHEIRTPMNGIIGMSSMLLGTDLSDEQREFSEIIHVSANTLLTIINDILDLSKIEADKLVLEKTEFDIVSVIEGVGELLAIQANNKHISLITYVNPKIPKLLQGDPVRLRQVLLNLVGNAVKFTEHGEIVVSAEVEASQLTTITLRFEVKDTGVGIAETDIDLLFQPFTQADNSTTRKYGGTGLGLVISKHLIGMMNGQIGVESQLGIGSSFWFTAQFDRGTHEHSHHSMTSPFNDIKVLIADSNQRSSEVISRYLASWEIESSRVFTEREVVTALYEAAQTTHPYHITILDISLLGFDDFALTQRIKGDPALSNTQLILLVAADRKGLDEIASRTGFSAYLTKPVKQSQLYNAIATVLDGNGELNYVAHRFVKPTYTQVPSDGAAKSPYNILLVEDNRINRKVAELQLKQLGCIVDTACNGIQAVTAITDKHAYDLVLMDCQMPEMDGFEATQTIRDLEKQTGKHVPIVAMTANAMSGDRELCLAAGMDDYISKPIKLDILNAMLKRWVSTSKP